MILKFNLRVHRGRAIVTGMKTCSTVFCLLSIITLCVRHIELIAQVNIAVLASRADVRKRFSLDRD